MHLRIKDLTEIEACAIIAAFDQVSCKYNKETPLQFVRGIAHARIGITESKKHGSVWIQRESTDSLFTVEIYADDNQPLRRLAALICFVCDPNRQVWLVGGSWVHAITAQMATLLP